MSEWWLLQHGAINPVGNLRVRPEMSNSAEPHAGFALEEMVSRGDAFVDHAYEVGAAVAGATDTQGEAPKFWVTQDRLGRWHPDDGQQGSRAVRYGLLKFPVPEAGFRATDILRHEAAYQRVAGRLGLRVTPELPQFMDGALLIPRFDRFQGEESEIRLGVESVYSLTGVLDSAHDSLRHHEVLRALHGCVTHFDTEVLEYFRRDILNLAMGNRDNHGRNTAILKRTDGEIELAPIFDFGPSFLDARAIGRSIHWDAERSGRIDWNEVLLNLASRFEDADLELTDMRAIAVELRNFAEVMDELPAVMRNCGVDEFIVKDRLTKIEELSRALREVTGP